MPACGQPWGSLPTAGNDQAVCVIGPGINDGSLETAFSKRLS